MVTPNGTTLDDTLAYPLFCKVYDDLKGESTLIAQKVFNLLDEEQFNLQLIAPDEWAFEQNTYGKLPNYAYDFLRKYIPRKYGLSYVFDRIPL